MSRVATSTPQHNLPQRTVASSSAPTPALFTPKEIVGMLRRRIWWIIIITTMFSFISVGLWFVCLKTIPRYTSRGLIKCYMPIQTDKLEAQRLIPTPGLIEQEVRSKTQELLSDAFLARILARGVVQQSDWYKSFGNDIEDSLDGLKEDFGATPLRDTDLVLVTMTTASPDESKKILDDILLLFGQEIKDKTEFSLRGDLTALNAIRVSVVNEINTKKYNLSEIRQKVNEPGWETGMSPAARELNDIAGVRFELQAALQEITAEMESLRQEAQETGYSNVVLNAAQNDPMVLGLRNRITAYKEERDGLLDKFGEEHDQVRQFDARIRSIETQMNQQESVLRDQYQAMQISSLEKEYEETNKRLTAMEEQYLAASNHQAEIDQKRQDVLVLTDEIDDLNTQLERIDASINSKTASVKNPIMAEVRSQGSKPLIVSFPRLTVFLPGGFILGLLLSVGLVFLLEFLDDSIKSPIDVSRHLNAPMLAMIPEYDEEDDKQVDLARITITQPHGLISESYRQLKTNLLFSAPGENLKTILVTAGIAGGGATTCLVNLGINLTRDSKRVLLIDGNFHRPGLRKIFPDDNEHGLSSLLVGQANAAEVIRSTQIQDLDVIGCGIKPPNPGELLQSSAMKTLLEQQRKAYDYILIDGPPSPVVSDARTMAALVDGVILVIHAGQTSRGVAQRMIREFRQAKAHILGILLNAVQPRKGGYYRQAFESYYDYVGLGEEESKKPEKAS